MEKTFKEANSKQGSPPLIVEFFGRGGAGKTTVHKKVVNRLKKRGYDVCTRDDLAEWLQSLSFFDKFLLILKWPFWTLRQLFRCFVALGLSLLKNPLRRFKKTVQSVADHVYLQTYLSNHDPDIVLLDQWSVQDFMTLWPKNYAPEKDTVIQYLKNINQKNEIRYVYFNVDLETAVQRRTKQNKDRGSKLNTDKKSLLRKFKAYTKRNFAVLQALEQHQPGLLKIDAIRPVSKNVEIIEEWIRKQFPENNNSTNGRK